MSNKENFKDNSYSNVVLSLVSKRASDDSKEKESETEVDVYNLLDCSKENMDAIDKVVKEKL